MAIPKGQIPANVVGINTVDAYLKFLADEIRRANDHWDHFGKAASAAYAKAYDSNGGVLKRVRSLQVARQAADDAMMSFALSLLTVGVAGAVAGGLIAIEGSRATETAARDVVKFVIKGIGGEVNDAVKALSPDRVPGGDVFAPADIGPTEYMAKMLEGISYNKGLLEDILHEVNYNQDADRVEYPAGTTVLLNRSGTGQVTAGTAKLLAEVITGTSFFQQMPSMSVNSDALTPKARLALWMGWALNRDPDYWSDGEQEFTENIVAGPGGGGGSLNRPSQATKEQPDWEPVRNDLLSLKVPIGMIASTLRTSAWTGNSARNGLYMWGFMEWAASVSAMDMLLDSTVRTSDVMAVQMAYARKARRVLTPKSLAHPHWIQYPEPVVTPL
jgi:hypothetical protein